MTNKELEQHLFHLTKRIEELESEKVNLLGKLYKIPEVAELLGVSQRTIYHMIERGELPTVKFGTTRIRATDLLKLIGNNINNNDMVVLNNV